jgi:hypothetical protein
VHPAMNDTKWNELRLAMHELNSGSPRWRTRDIESGYESSWDREWFYHFREGGYRTIEWVEIAADNSEQLSEVQTALARIHVPGGRTETGFRVYGYIPAGKVIDYVPPA